MVLIICTKNESNLTNGYWDMVPDRQKVRTDGRMDGRTEWTDGRTDDAKTISLRLRRGIIKHIKCFALSYMYSMDNQRMKRKIKSNILS